MPDSNITKKALASAMKELMTKKSFAKISVGDICELCDMNRKSFYYHFKDKYDLVNWIYYTECVGTIQAKPYKDGWRLMEDVCTYFYENKRFYQNALQVSGQNSFREYFQTILQAVLQGYMREAFLDDENAAFFTNFFTDAFLAAIERWLLEMPCRPPRDFVRLLKTSITEFAEKIVDSMEQEGDHQQ